MLNRSSITGEIARRFAKHAADYPSHSQVQRGCEDKLYQRLADRVPKETLVVDLGAGRARGLCDWVRENPARVGIAVDFAGSALNCVDTNRVLPVCSNLHSLAFKSGILSTVVSNFALQWCEPSVVSLEIARVLQPEGVAMLSVPVQGSLFELSCASAQAGDDVVNKLPSSEDWMNSFSDFYCEKMSLDEYQINYSSLMCLLRGIQGMGASSRHHKSGRGLKTRRWLDRLVIGYAPFVTRQNNQNLYPVTWKVLTLQLQKKASI